MSELYALDNGHTARWDDVNSMYTEWDRVGAVVVSRAYSAAELAAASARASAVIDRDASMKAQADMEQIAKATAAVNDATTPTPGSPWVQPKSAVDSYKKGATVTYGGKEWESLIPWNVWAPGVAGWREVATGAPAAWVQPSGSADAYKKGDRVTFNGSVWESVIDANVWSPSAYPAGWKLI